LPATLTIFDESATGETLLELTLRVSAERITVRDLIRQRVGHEVDEFNRRRPDTFRGLVQPTDPERTLNGYRLKQPRAIDAATQIAKAIDAFEGNQIIMLVDVSGTIRAFGLARDARRVVRSRALARRLPPKRMKPAGYTGAAHSGPPLRREPGG
jgi:hypothetical protein